MPTTRNIAIFGAIAAIFVLVYIFFLRSPSDNGAALISSSDTSSDASLQVTTASSDNSLMANDFLTLLLSVKSIKLDDAIFADSAFFSLHDSSITLVPDGNEGRSNPFAPIGSDPLPPPPPAPPSTAPAPLPPAASTPPSSTPPATPPKTGTTTTPKI